MQAPSKIVFLTGCMSLLVLGVFLQVEQHSLPVLLLPTRQRQPPSETTKQTDEAAVVRLTEQRVSYYITFWNSNPNNLDVRAARNTFH